MDFLVLSGGDCRVGSVGGEFGTVSFEMRGLRSWWCLGRGSANGVGGSEMQVGEGGLRSLIVVTLWNMGRLVVRAPGWQAR